MEGAGRGRNCFTIQAGYRYHTYIHTYIHTAVSGQGGLETVERPALMLQCPTSFQVVDTGTHWVESFQESLRE